jgi:propanediol dehydratase small subunit
MPAAPDNTVEILFKKAGTQVHRHDYPIGPTTATAVVSVPIDSAAGTATWTVVVDNSVGVADLTLTAASNRKSWFRIHDEGPNGAPA